MPCMQPSLQRKTLSRCFSVRGNVLSQLSPPPTEMTSTLESQAGGALPRARYSLLCQAGHPPLSSPLLAPSLEPPWPEAKDLSIPSNKTGQTPTAQQPRRDQAGERTR